MSLFAHDLELSSKGSASRRLLRTVEDLGLDLLGATSPAELGRRLQEEDPATTELVGRYLEAASRKPSLVSLGLVVITPAVARAVKRAGVRARSSEFFDELSVTLLEALREVAAVPVTSRRAWLAATAVRRARAATRRPAGQLQVIHLDDSIDVEAISDAEADASRLEGRELALWTAIAEGIVDEETWIVIDATRGFGFSLADFADYLDVNYETLRSRRSRAEAKLREFILDVEEGR
jgi:DNA-directed RNA polymerase specialized sigma24 family protein